MIRKGSILLEVTLHFILCSNSANDREKLSREPGSIVGKNGYLRDLLTFGSEPIFNI